MHLHGLVVQIFMSASFIAGITMIVFTLGYRHRLRRVERLARYTLGSLLVYSVGIRFILLLPGKFPFMEESSLIFDVFYIALCIFFNINVLSRRSDKNGE